MVTQRYTHLSTSFYIPAVQFTVCDEWRKYKYENPEGTIHLLTPVLESEAGCGFIFPNLQQGP